MRNMIKDLSNLKDAFRVLEILDNMGGVDIEKVTRSGFENGDNWIIKPKSYIPEKDAKDLRKICLYKEHYSKESKLFRWLFYRHYRGGTRDFYSSFDKKES